MTSHSDHPVLRLLDPDEQLQAHAEASDAHLVVTSRRVGVLVNDRFSLAIGFHELRRVQFDIERDRPATLVLVPDAAKDPPQVLSIPPAQYRRVGEALVLIGERLGAGMDEAV